MKSGSRRGGRRINKEQKRKNHSRKSSTQIRNVLSCLGPCRWYFHRIPSVLTPRKITPNWTSTKHIGNRWIFPFFLSYFHRDVSSFHPEIFVLVMLIDVHDKAENSTQSDRWAFALCRWVWWGEFERGLGWPKRKVQALTPTICMTSKS